ncbi:3-hydroxyacyl-CoA dehydrogenase NAD-binding domain-containing protein [Microbulbifer halophilus]|uniref:3-hydroxyacyl-CoA dehydrogenase NAD-binding domain-containing protein n=1 Tax=Microbulbifer halophilus TaxID=453963 RepID=A0ABW5EGT8_9GAMM|nr:3-hydroxyacyl-CoA dehydrogenase NAD-binding domain-containing protein [Microbulbifer halophilus]MCW8128497.1 3-hydroxyacyl-CoA dehydrogenase NAD-binding domain-containing protein [Microbulbifer halophilus]
MSLVHYEIRDGIGVIRLNNPPVNALSTALRRDIQEAFAAAREDASEALLLICDGRTFVAGADISEFDKPPQPPSLPEVIEQIEQSHKPVIASLHGTALGGGLELALACHYRCGLASARVGLPEVKLGLLPGAGGTQRLPRLVGVEKALKIISGGKPIPAVEAEKMGLLDRVFDTGAADLLPRALEYAREIIDRRAGPRRVGELPAPSAGAETFSQFRQQLDKRSRGQLAPQLIVDAVQAATEQPLQRGLETERQLFVQCRESDQSHALRHVFFAEREAARVDGLEGVEPRPVHSVGIIGAGTMGGGIAMCFASAGIPVTLLEMNGEALERGRAAIERNYATAVRRGKLDEVQKERCLAAIRGTTDYGDLAQVDLVIEAVFEDLNVKREVFARLDRTCRPGAILASNTSYQDLDAIAAATARPYDVVGLHFFSPANIMKLLEVVRGKRTADDVLATAMKLAKRIGKMPVLSGVCYGFIGNRMLRRYGSQAQLCLIEGASPEQVDGAMESWGMAMGPIAVGDLAGLDIGYRARQSLDDEQKGDPRSYCIADALVEQGRLGQKSGAGFYRYDAETRSRKPDPLVASLIEEKATEFDVVRRTFTDAEIRERLLLALVNEGAKILEEGIAQRPGDIDVVYIYGYGFPAHRGGPMFYADSRGLRGVYAAICDLQAQYGGDCWEPAPLLRELAESEMTFAGWAEGNRQF